MRHSLKWNAQPAGTVFLLWLYGTLLMSKPVGDDKPKTLI